MPRCYPGTRQSALLVVTDWIFGRRDGTGKSIMWVTGAPGIGKTAILQTVCETLASSDQPTAWLSSTVLALGECFPILEATCSALKSGTSIDASFFFARGEVTREKAFYFPATIAYQIAQSRTSYRSAVRMELAKRPCTLSETFSSQFRRLIINPAKTLAPFQNPIIIVIDALDECDSIVDQATLLNLILEACATSKIRFLIASRREQNISSFFRRADVAQHTCCVQLDDALFNTNHDIELFLRSEFNRIRLSKPEACSRLPNGEDWPGSAVIRELATYSDSQFMFPHLAIEYIDTEFFSPHQQLQNLLTSPPPSVFQKLDSLYHLILSRRPPSPFQYSDANAELNHYPGLVSGILRVINLWPGGPFSAARIAGILGEKVDVVQQTIRGPLRSLFKLSEDPESVVTFCHRSLADCLSDPRRAGEHFIPRDGLDPLYHRILSRQPPSGLLSSHYREALKGVILVLATWPIQSSVPEIASLLDLTPSVVRSVVSGPAQPLFTTNLEGAVLFSHISIKNFFMDVDRSGEFFIPSDRPDALLLQILSRQPPSPDKGPWNTYSRDVLIDVLRVVITWPGLLTVAEIAATLHTLPTVVQSVFDRLPRSLFVSGEHLVAFNPHCGIEAFLLDANRSGEFFIPDGSAEALSVHLLSRRPPVDIQPPLPRGGLMIVVEVAEKLPYCLITSGTAPSLDFPLSIVRANVQDEATRLLSRGGSDHLEAFSRGCIETLINTANRMQYQQKSQTLCLLKFFPVGTLLTAQCIRPQPTLR